MDFAFALYYLLTQIKNPAIPGSWAGRNDYCANHVSQLDRAMTDTTIIPQKLHLASDNPYLKLPEYKKYLLDVEKPMRQRFHARVEKMLHTVTITMQGELIKARCQSLTDRDERPGGDRAAIRYFSPASRKNMLETVSRMNWSRQRATFITLTYHEPVADAKLCKTHLRTFEKRLYRRYGNKTVIWRMDIQPERLRLTGQVAWHFHLIVLDLPYAPRTTNDKNGLLDWWRDITGQPSITQLGIELIHSAKKARSYVSKYSGKAENGVTYLDYLANLPVDQLPGRFWGIENRALIPWAELITWTITAWSEFSGYFDFKRAARQHWKGVNGSRFEGWTIFVRDVGAWDNMLQYLTGTEYSARRKYCEEH